MKRGNILNRVATVIAASIAQATDGLSDGRTDHNGVITVAGGTVPLAGIHLRGFGGSGNNRIQKHSSMGIDQAVTDDGGVAENVSGHADNPRVQCKAPLNMVTAGGSHYGAKVQPKITDDAEQTVETINLVAADAATNNGAQYDVTHQ